MNPVAMLCDLPMFLHAVAGLMFTGEVPARFARGFVVVGRADDPATYCPDATSAAKVLEAALHLASLEADDGELVSYEVRLHDPEREVEVRRALAALGVQHVVEQPPSLAVH